MVAGRLQFCQSEVQNFCLPSGGHEDIGRLDVAVDNALRVRGIESVGNLNRQFEELFRLERLTLDEVLEGLPLQQLHSDERLSIIFHQCRKSCKYWDD